MANILVDLEAFAGSEFIRKKIPRLKAIVRKASNTQSCYADLHQAGDFFEALRKQPVVNSDFQSQGYDAVASSLLTSAVIFYARATSTSGSKGERGSIDIRSELDGKEREDHSLIVAVRNKAIAHVYPDHDFEEIRWHRQKIFLATRGGGLRPASASNMISLNAHIARALDRQLPVAQKIVHEKFQNFMDKISDELRTSALPYDAYQPFIVDPKEYFQNEKVAAAIFDPPNNGNVRRFVD